MQKFYALTDSQSRWWNGATFQPVITDECMYPAAQYTLQQLHDAAMNILGIQGSSMSIYIVEISILRVSAGRARNAGPGSKIAGV